MEQKHELKKNGVKESDCFGEKILRKMFGPVNE